MHRSVPPAEITDMPAERRSQPRRQSPGAARQASGVTRRTSGTDRGIAGSTRSADRLNSARPRARLPAGLGFRRDNAGPRRSRSFWQERHDDIYVARPASRRPAWLIPLLILLVSVVAIFWIAPALIRRIRNPGLNNIVPTAPSELLRYPSSTYVVTQPVADLFAMPAVDSERIGQALYNEPVSLLGSASEGFVKARLSDGMEGFLKTAALTSDRRSVEPAAFQNKIVIITPLKRVMSHASDGTLLVEIPMGTILFADYRGDGIVRVLLPTGEAGWLSNDGLVILRPDEAIAIPMEGARAFCDSALAFRLSTMLSGGVSLRGISTTGMVFIAARVNGLDLPRSLSGLAGSGQSVELRRDTGPLGRPDLSTLRPGDLIFLSDPVYRDRIGDVAVYVDTNLILYARPTQTSLRLIDLNANTDLWDRIRMVRRLYA